MTFSINKFSFHSIKNYKVKLPYDSYINNNHQQNVQNERKITDHLQFNRHHYHQTPNEIFSRQRFKRDTDNLFKDNELYSNYNNDDDQNDGMIVPFIFRIVH